MGDSFFGDVIPKFPLLKQLGTGASHAKCRSDHKLLSRLDPRAANSRRSMALGMLQRKEVEYRPRRERAIDHVERIRCLAAGGRTSLEPTGRGMNTTAKGRISPREYSEYLPPTDKGGQSKIDLVNMEKEFFKDANAASLEFARENCVDKLKCVDKSKADMLRRLGIVSNHPTGAPTEQHRGSASCPPHRTSPVPRVGLDELMAEAFPPSGSGIFCELSTPHGRRGTLPVFSQTLKRKPVLHISDARSQHQQPGGNEILNPHVKPNRGLLDPVNKPVAQFHPCPKITAMCAGSMAMQYAPAHNALAPTTPIERPPTRGSQGSGLSEMEFLGHSMNLGGVEDFWQAEDVQISSAASTQYLPIVVGMSKSENSNHAEPEMPQPIVWH